MELSHMLNKLKPYLAIISLQFGYAGMYIVTMVSLKGGMSHWILVVYRHAAAILAVAPFALILERKTRPKMTLSIFLKVLLLGFLEYVAFQPVMHFLDRLPVLFPPVVDQNLYYVGMTYTSATFASATVNVLPAITFIMAVIFRLEKVNLKRGASVAKVIGTAITVSGAMVMTLYKGPIVNILPYHPGGGDQHHHNNSTTSTENQHWVTGTILLLCCICSWSAFFIAQSITLKEYPAELSLAALICVAGMVESGVVALIMERDISAWTLGFDSRLLAAVYSGVVCSGIAYYIQSVIIKARGPVFLTAFTPLSMVITAVLAAIILAEQVHLGSLIGAGVIVIGLYSVVWGKSKEQKYLNEKGDDTELPVVVDSKNNSSIPNYNHVVDPLEQTSKPYKNSSTFHQEP